MKRRKPLRRSWFRSTSQSWRRSPEYREAVEQAFELYMVGDSYCRCAFCGRVFTLDKIAPCHIFHVGTASRYHALAMEPKNLLPGCFICHGRFDHKTDKNRQRQIEEMLPGRWEELINLNREKACVVAR